MEVTELDEAIHSLCRRFGVQSLELFGSAARGETAPNDFDFFVRFLPATPELHAERYFGLLAALQDLLHADVDLVELGAIKNPYFLMEASKSRRSLYAA